jgi:hypothetical protein
LEGIKTAKVTKAVAPKKAIEKKDPAAKANPAKVAPEKKDETVTTQEK